jgi:hypothetical protein
MRQSQVSCDLELNARLYEVGKIEGRVSLKMDLEKENKVVAGQDFSRADRIWYCTATPQRNKALQPSGLTEFRESF